MAGSRLPELFQNPGTLRSLRPIPNDDLAGDEGLDENGYLEVR